MRRLGAVVTLVLLLAACTPAPETTAPPAPPCVSSGGTPGASPSLPDLALPCFDGSATVHLGQLRGPAVVNLWASWCAPCRQELPAVQRFAVRAAGQVAVIGVNTMDTRQGGDAIVEDFGLTFPVLVDEPGALLRQVAARQALPVTLFVDRDGRVAYTYQAEALDDATLTGLVARYLGVAVPA